MSPLPRTTSPLQPPRGFTLVETLVAVTILLAVTAGVLGLAAHTVSFIGLPKDKIIAFYLAQEPIEYIRARRDNNRLSGGTPDWLEGIRAPCVTGAPCVVDFTAGTVASCGGVCSVLRCDTATGVYGYLSGTATTFIRTTVVTETVPNQEAVVNVTVTWPHKGTTKSFTMRENILNIPF